MENCESGSTIDVISLKKLINHSRKRFNYDWSISLGLRPIILIVDPD